RFTCPQCKANEDQEEQDIAHPVADQPGKHTENAPPHDTDSEHLARAKPARKPAARNLERRIPDQERTEYPAQFDLVELELLAHLNARNRYVGAIEKRDRT